MTDDVSPYDILEGATVALADGGKRFTVEVEGYRNGSVDTLHLDPERDNDYRARKETPETLHRRLTDGTYYLPEIAQNVREALLAIDSTTRTPVQAGDAA